MLRVEHPVARRDDGRVDDAVDVNGDMVPIADDGTFEIPDDARSWLESWAANYDVDADDLVDDDTATCDVVKQDGEVCGRKLPCPYHDDTEE